jgi:predicted HNH restriction endonuclease
MDPDHKTTIDELMCICSNCHFAVHTGDPDANLRSLRILFAGALANNKEVEQIGTV